jgi:hypothetical protein
MRKKTKEIILLLIGFCLVIAFLQVIYNPYYYSLPPEANSNPNDLFHKIENFMEPTNLSIFISILFFAGVMLIVLFET